jgi:glycosyltransferase involved in cell wall biosynthesis
LEAFATPAFWARSAFHLLLVHLGGGECAPKQLRKSYPLRGKIVDAVRDLWNALVPFDPILRLQFSQASLILIKTPDNIALVPKFARWKVQQLFEIGIDQVPKPVGATKTKNPTVLFAGRCQFWKGMHLGIGAIAQAMIALPDLTLTIAGDGPERELWERQASVLGIAHRVTWLGWQPKDALDALYQSHHLVLFPSLHDSSGNVVLEASIRGTPVVCLDCGGPGALLPSTAGVKIPVQSRTENEVVDMMAAAIKHYLSAPAELEKLAKTAEEWAREQTWASRVVAAYADFTPTRNGGA